MRLFGLFDEDCTAAAEYLARFSYPWEALGGLGDFVALYGRASGFNEISEGVYAHTSAAISPYAHIEPPCVICEGAQLRQGAYIRGGVLIGRGCVVGNCSELKNCILSDGARLPHFNYAGDSILGRGAHLGAGAIISNLRADGGEVRAAFGGGIYPTGRRKAGAFVGDFAEIGCNAVLNPGTTVGVGGRVYPLACVRGEVPAGSIFKGVK